MFGKVHGDTLFVSIGGSTLPEHANELGIRLLSKVFDDLEVAGLVDRDFASGGTTDQNDRRTYPDNNPQPPGARALGDRELPVRSGSVEVVPDVHSLDFDEYAYSRFVDDIADDSVKDRTGDVKRACGVKGSISPYHFKMQLATYLTSDTSVYREFEACVLGRV